MLGLGQVVGGHDDGGVVVDPGGPWIELDRDVLAPVLALAGWAAWDDPLGLRILAILCAYGLVLATLARTDTYYWAFLIAPLLPAGLAFAPDAIASLWSRILDRRRITVHMGAR